VADLAGSAAQDQTLRAGLYMVATTAFFVATDACIKFIGTSLPLGQIIGSVSFLSTIIILTVCAQQGILEKIAQIISPKVLLRSLLEVMATFMFLAALMHMPLANISAIMQTVPLAVVVIAILFLGEKAGVRRLLPVAAGFLGVLFVVKPSFQSVSIYEVLALGTVGVVAIRELVTKRIPAHVPLLIVALANAVCVSLGGFAVGAVQGFQAVEMWQLALLCMAAMGLALGYVLIVLTVRLGELSATAPFRYAEVLFAIIAGIFVFNEYPDFLSYFGMILIVAAGLYAARHEALQNRLCGAKLISPLHDFSDDPRDS
jgi:drug/metabolite transporter (DMT)-like permease